jgi:GTP-binding protein LepA
MQFSSFFILCFFIVLRLERRLPAQDFSLTNLYPTTLSMNHIRNFCIIAHIDHGKSTLADRLLEYTGTLQKREMTVNQVLDSNPLEQERGITIKLHAIQMRYKAADNSDYTLNLIDTPGHVDFSYEVSRSLAACEGALLIVDATQGVEAQTISNLYLAIDAGLEIIPVINKIDLPSASTTLESVKQQVIDLLGCREEDMILASGKTGIGVQDILEAVVRRIPPPKGDPQAPLRALIYDSIFDPYLGVVVNVRVIDGVLREKDKIYFYATDKTYEVEECGYMKMSRVRTGELSAGNVGYITASVKNLHDTRVGDTITHTERKGERIAGFKEVKPMVFSGIYPADSDDFEDLRESLQKLSLNDSAITFEPESSAALGFGFRCGFLGLLHMEIVQERLEREFQQTIVTTVPTVRYKLIKTNGEEMWIESPSQMPENTSTIDEIYEPFIKAQIITPTEYIGAIMKLCMDRRGVFLATNYLTETRVEILFELPLAEVIFDFYDKLKSGTRGYASLDYEMIELRPGNLVKLDILLNGEPVDALSSIVHRDKAYEWGRKLCGKLKELIPRQMFEVAIQAAIGAKIIARDNISAIRKNVLAKCYGGDISRKRKLLEKQKEGKKRMKQIGRVEVPQEAFLAVLSLDKD